LLHRITQAGKGGLFRHRQDSSGGRPKPIRLGRKSQVFQTFLDEAKFNLRMSLILSFCQIPESLNNAFCCADAPM
ncbi:hypothetical protein, partial [Roseovarius sp. A46]|uniref:hypothetical protein n=1 Tax=Roseovarius sp. A46 TaxID=2109331 RepID=UPI0019D6D002